MRKLIFLLMMIGILSLSVVSTLAQEDNDPNTNPDANACLAGGSMEGKCNNDADGDGVVTDEEIDWQWTCGWYLIRFEHGLLPGIPEDCAILISYYPDPFCIFNEIFYSGVPNEFGNVIFFDGGNCWEGESYGGNQWVVIIAADLIGDAMDICTGLVGEPNGGIHIYSYPGENEDLWLCFDIGGGGGV